MTKSKKPDSKRDRLWAEAKRHCRLNVEDIRMAKELGLNPRSLINNIPSANQQLRLSVRQWIHELYEKKTGKALVKRSCDTQTAKEKPAENDHVPLRAYSDEPAPKGSRINSLHTLNSEWDEYAGELWVDDEPLWLPESLLYREIQDENQKANKRQDDFRLAAQYVARQFGHIAAVEKVMLFGSVALPLREEKPRYRKYRRAGVPMLHECKDIDLAVLLRAPRIIPNFSEA